MSYRTENGAIALNSTDNNNESIVFEREVVIGNRMGLHSRPAAMIARMLSQSNCDVSLIRDGGKGESADCRSVLSMLILAAGRGTRLILRASGSDAEQLIGDIGNYFDRNFDEDDSE